MMMVVEGSLVWDSFEEDPGGKDDEEDAGESLGGGARPASAPRQEGKRGGGGGGKCKGKMNGGDDIIAHGVDKETKRKARIASKREK